MLFYSLVLLHIFLIRTSLGSRKIPLTPVIITTSGVAEFGKPFKLKCSFKSLPNTIALFWFEGNDIIYGQKRTEIIYHKQNLTTSYLNFTTVDKHNLTFDPLLPSDIATYKCLVETKERTSHEAKFTISIPPFEVTAKEGQDVSLKCELNGPVAGAKVIWFKQNSYIKLHKSRVEKYKLNDRGELSIQNVTQSDEASYSCYKNGTRRRVNRVRLHKTPKKNGAAPPTLSGTNGYAFGITLGVIVTGLLISLYCMQNRVPYAWEKDLVKQKNNKDQSAERITLLR